MFPNGIDLPENASPDNTKQQLAGRDKVFFQPSFLTDDGIYARVDILEKLPNGHMHLYEIKSSTRIKKDSKHNHLKDACFQKYVLEKSGYQIDKVYIIHLHKTFIKEGDISPQDLLKINDVTDDIENLYSEVVRDIRNAIAFINKPIIDETKCQCKYKTKGNHCDSFSYFNPDIPEYNIYQFNGIREKKINQLLDQGFLDLNDIPDNLDIPMPTKHIAQLKSFRKKAPIVNKDEIDKAFNGLKFPLHFFDYEGYASSIPQLDGFKPHQQLIFQVSLHTMQEDGSIYHFEYLSDRFQKPEDLIKDMYQFTNGNTGTFICWHQQYERDRNKEMMEQVPAYSSYLEYINNHLFDLKEMFYTGYVDYRFKGSASIKNVLPVLVPDLSYKNLEVQDGTMALDTWGRMVSDPNFSEDKDQTRKNLLEYCKLDTLAMVEIYNKLASLIQ